MRRTVQGCVRLAGLLVAVILVLGTGLGVRAPEPAVPRHSPTEQAQLDAEAGYSALAADARAAAALEPAAAAVLTAIAEDLEVQTDAVTPPRSPGSSTPEPGGPGSALPSPGPSSPGPSSSPGAVATGPAVLTGLRKSALRSLRDAAQAEPGPGRVLAAAGANQWRNAVLLAGVLGAEPGLPSADTVRADDLAAGTGFFVGLPGTPDGTAAATPGEAPVDCTDTPLGPDEDRAALLQAKAAEDSAAYGYDVAAALLPDPADALARSAVHRSAAATAAEQLTLLCAPAGPAPTGFTLAAGFRADPAGSLKELEQDHAVLYAGLIAAVGDDTRAWAVTSYNAAVQRSLDAGTQLTALPGMEGAADAGDGSTSGIIAPPDGVPPAGRSGNDASSGPAEPGDG